MSLSDHLQRVTTESQVALRTTLETLHDEQMFHVLVGGWAVFAYGSRIPSIDTDIYLRPSDEATFREAIKRRGMAHLGSEHIEILDWTGRNELHGFDWELDDVPAYVPAEVLSGSLSPMKVPGLPEDLRATVPQRPALALTKLKAFHDRSFDFDAVTDPTYMARVNPSDRPRLAQKPPGHYLRKAGKDLFDVAFLCSEENPLDNILAAAPHLAAPLRAALDGIAAPIHHYAMQMATTNAPAVRWIERHTAVRR